jgi:D-hexose-6-phosphate mutarotase
VVWNPDVKDAEMADVGEGQHCYFVCAEAANAMDDVVTVAPGGEGHLAMELWTE